MRPRPRARRPLEALGEAAADRWGVGVGDRIVVEEYLPCGTCRSCLDGAYQMCRVRRYGGRATARRPGLWGGYADYLVPAPAVDRPPRCAGRARGARAALHPGLERPPLGAGVGGARPGDTVVVVGPGPHGLGCVIGAQEAGAGLCPRRPRAGPPPPRVGRRPRRRPRADGRRRRGRLGLSELTGGRMAQTVVNAPTRRPRSPPHSPPPATARRSSRWGSPTAAARTSSRGGAGARAGRARAELRGVAAAPAARPRRAPPDRVRPLPARLMNTGTFGVEETEAALNAIATDRGASARSSSRRHDHLPTSRKRGFSSRHQAAAHQRRLAHLTVRLSRPATSSRARWRHVFRSCWIFVAHESEIADGGDYKTAHIGRQPVIVDRGADDGASTSSSTAAATAARLSASRSSATPTYFRCAYHGWTYASDGELIGVPYADAYGEDFDKSDDGPRPRCRASSPTAASSSRASTQTRRASRSTSGTRGRTSTSSPAWATASSCRRARTGSSTRATGSCRSRTRSTPTTSRSRTRAGSTS